MRAPTEDIDPAKADPTPAGIRRSRSANVPPPAHQCSSYPTTPYALHRESARRAADPEAGARRIDAGTEGFAATNALRRSNDVPREGAHGAVLR